MLPPRNHCRLWPSRGTQEYGARESTISARPGPNEHPRPLVPVEFPRRKTNPQIQNAQNPGMVSFWNRGLARASRTKFGPFRWTRIYQRSQSRQCLRKMDRLCLTEHRHHSPLELVPLELQRCSAQHLQSGLLRLVTFRCLAPLAETLPCQPCQGI
jgi:hypothetical protein